MERLNKIYIIYKLYEMVYGSIWIHIGPYGHIWVARGEKHDLEQVENKSSAIAFFWGDVGGIDVEAIGAPCWNIWARVLTRCWICSEEGRFA